MCSTTGHNKSFFHGTVLVRGANLFFLQYALKTVLLILQKYLLVDPHECARVIWLALVLNAVEAVSPLAVIPLVVVVVFHLPHCFKRSQLCELKETHDECAH